MKQVWLVILIDWETRVVAVYDNEAAANAHAASGPDYRVEAATILSTYDA
jgi:hypothetical protein